MTYFRLPPDDIIVFHGELDLAPGSVRLTTGGRHAGHNGLRSIHGHIGPDYDRVRMGIGHPGHKDAVAGYVLRDFPKADAEWLDDELRGISDGVADLIAGHGDKFLNAIALRVSPPRSSNAAPTPAKPQTAPDPVVDDRSAMQKLVDRFR